MKFDDSDEDYFLHDFSGKNQPQESAGDGYRSPAPSQPVTDRQPAAPSFDFSDGNTDNGSPTPGTSGAPRKRRHGWWWFFLIVAAVLIGAVGIRYFVPYVTESRATGYVTLVEKRGIVFPTFEGEMVSESQLADTARIYSRDLNFSIPDEDLALRLQKYQGSGRPVTVTFKRYYGTLPWRGASNTIAVDFVPAGE